MGNRPDQANITLLLREWQNGSQEAFDRLVPLVYTELHTIASRHMGREWRRDRATSARTSRRSTTRTSRA
jgi:hypothetical protein